MIQEAYIVERDKRDELEKGLISREQISKLTQQASTQITQMNVREIKTLCQNCEEKSAQYKEQGYVPISMKNDFLEIYPDPIKRADEQYIEEEYENAA